eukprot:gene98-132_t
MVPLYSCLSFAKALFCLGPEPPCHDNLPAEGGDAEGHHFINTYVKKFNQFCLKLGCVLLGYDLLYQRICQHLFLPTRWDVFLQHPWSILTYFWVHDLFFPTLWDTLCLYAFGNIIISIWHSRSLLWLYLLGGLFSGISVLAIYYIAPGLKHSPTEWLTGSAGCLYAIMVAAASILPHTRFRFPFLGNIKLKHIANALILLACLDLLSSSQPPALARLSGAVVGYLYVRCVRKWQQKRSPLRY